ncbi:MAG: hypothetical protein Q7T80_07455 [Methanoregula sp.]|nr:hypothetical protein [Methanoregula sp.]
MKISTIRAITIVLFLLFLVTPVAASVYYTTSAPDIITKGDTFSISGTKATNGMCTIWIIGRNYFDTLAVTPDRHGNFSVSLKPTTTEKFSEGQYAIVLQNPGPGGIVEIEPGTDINGNLTIMNRGKIIEKLGARQDLKGNVQSVVTVLMDAANLQGVDDSFIVEYLFVEEPIVQFDNLVPGSTTKLSDQITGDRIVLTGTTNMGTENYLRAHIYNKSSNELITSNTLPIVAGSQSNHWSYELNAPGLPRGEYYLTVGWEKSNETGTGLATFTVKDSNSSTPLPQPYPGMEKIVPRDDFSTLLFLTISGVIIVILIVFAVGKNNG